MTTECKKVRIQQPISCLSFLLFIFYNSKGGHSDIFSLLYSKSNPKLGFYHCGSADVVLLGDSDEISVTSGPSNTPPADD